jgi:NADH-quinone oxidoreductase subunit E
MPARRAIAARSLREGREGVRSGLKAMFAQFPQNRADILASYELGETVLLHETVSRAPDGEQFEVMSIYSFQRRQSEPRGVHPLMADANANRRHAGNPRTLGRNFAWTAENAAKAATIRARYPEGRQQSCGDPLSRPRPASGRCGHRYPGLAPDPGDRVRREAELDLAVIRVLEVATFYTMFNLHPVGKYHVQVCGTTPCWLRGSDDVFAACKNRGMAKGKTTPDGLFTLTEVECMGNCSSAPMVQINDDNYEDLDYDRTVAILDALANGQSPKAGTQNPKRHTSEPEGGPTTLKEMVKANHDYRKEW